MNVKTFEILQSVDSTNNHAMKLAREGRTKGWCSFFALEQTKGKGQRSKTWESGAGQNIIMSSVADCSKLILSQQFQLSCIIAIGCYEMLKKYGGDEFSIKWPNDIYWRDRKAGGILIENIISGTQWEKSIIGTGININQTSFGQMDRKPVSLKQITGKTFDPIALGMELSELLALKISEISIHPIEYHLSQYNEALYMRNKQARLKKGNQIFEAEILGVKNNGNMSIHHGMETEVEFGSIEWLT